VDIFERDADIMSMKWVPNAPGSVVLLLITRNWCRVVKVNRPGFSGVNRWISGFGGRSTALVPLSVYANLRQPPGENVCVGIPLQRTCSLDDNHD
jgi:hypothetical protein